MTATTWNPSDKGSRISLSGGNLIATITAGGVTLHSARATSNTLAAPTKWYWEVVVTGPSSDISNLQVGVANATFPVSSASFGLGNSADATGVAFNFAPTTNAGVFHNSSAVGGARNTVLSGDVLGFALDSSARTLDIYVNNVLRWSLVSANLPSGDLYPAMGANNGGASAVATANFGGTTTTYTPPTGYSTIDTPLLNFSITGSGGMTIGGAAATFPSSAVVGSGGLAFGGSADVQFHVALLIDFVGSGGLSFGGSADTGASQSSIFNLSDYGQPVGGMVLGGAAVVKEVIPHLPTGGMVLGGAAAVSEVIPFYPSGGMLMGGAAAFAAVFAEIGAGGMLMGGTAAFKALWVEIGSGGMVLSGAALVKDYQALFVPSGGMKLGGEAICFFLGPLDVATPENPYNDDFLGWAVNLETGAPSLYLRLPANSFCQFQGRTFCANAAGIYELGAARDAGQPIRATIMPPTSDYGSPNRKRVSHATLAARIETEARLAVATDKGSFHYYALGKTDGLAAVRVKLGQGLEGRYFTWRLENVDGGDLALDTLSFTPAILTRRARGG